jgi:GNAT superfamily N-acetyltransferase
MTGVSQSGLIEFANTFRQPPAPGFEIVESPRYRIVLQPDFPHAGPNSTSWIRCHENEADEVIVEVRSRIAPRHVPFMWTLDPDTQPANFPFYLAARDVHPDPHGPTAAVMVLPIAAGLELPVVENLELRDALSDLDDFRKADGVNAEAFQARPLGSDPAMIAAQDRRRRNQLEAGNRRVILATIDGEPAGSASVSLFPPTAAIINGGAVRPKFRGRGIYRALVAARLNLARQAGVEGGLVVWGGDMSAPILTRLGFEAVGSRKFYVDTSTA